MFKSQVSLLNKQQETTQNMFQFMLEIKTESSHGNSSALFYSKPLITSVTSVTSDMKNTI